MPLSTSTTARFYFYSVRKASKICCQTVLFRCGNTSCCLLYQRASLCNKQGCSACFIKKQRSISIRMPLRHQSVCSLLSQRLQDRIKQHISKSIRSFSSSLKCLGYFLPVDESLPPRLIPNLLLLIQTLAFIFYKIHSVLNIMMTVDSLFLFKAVLCIRSSFQSCPRPLLFPSICSFFHLSTFMKTSNPSLCRPKKFVHSLEIVFY